MSEEVDISVFEANVNLFNVRVRILITSNGSCEMEFDTIDDNPPISIDLSNFESGGEIVEVTSNGETKTTMVEFDSNGNPTKITDGDGYSTDIIW